MTTQNTLDAQIGFDLISSSQICFVTLLTNLIYFADTAHLFIYACQQPVSQCVSGRKGHIEQSRSGDLIQNMPEIKHPEDEHSPSLAAKTLQSLTSTEQRLLTALREFIRQENTPRSEAPVRVSLQDAIWLIMAFGCIFLALSQIDQTWLSSEIPKLLIDKILPWFLSIGAIATVFKSPESVLAVTRNSRFRWTILPVLLLLFLGALPLYKVKARITGEATLYVDGNLQHGDFRINFRPHDIELRSDDSHIPSRHFRLTRGDLMHGFLLQPDWRLVYPTSLDIVDDNLLVCFEPQHFKIDSNFGEEAANIYRRLGPSALEYSASAGGFNMLLPAGIYHVTGFRYGCGVTPSLVLEVGPNAPTEALTLQRANCTSQLPLSLSPCDGLLSNDHF